ncbi:class I SAM-dependent methyltransferase [Conexibacter sp. CPCC 206217]|uniref:class I SAM-dependent methyltransferase n=1 Tax=Conexibacter sp. CPCC 206217 TaxID=3064574 RepID=UPI002715D85C|nr:methyltransferase domain-containing protein [Conexibacter sp. CPCC 206217]MDO8212902.1 methyltransferase domain-containing protein [Conexibacter sp. CPCC 206217]
MSGADEHEIDPDEVRAGVRDHWERAAPGWRESSGRFNATAMDVAQWLVDAIRPQPGMRVLELAAGIGETGFLAAELIEPGGVLVSTDGAEAMLEQARGRAQELGLRNVEFKPVDIEWIDAQTAEFDAVLCRFGYMFALDREAAFRETRRVLRPGGRVAFATWTAFERNPWSRITRTALYDAGLTDTLEILRPNPFDLSTPEIVTALLEDTGFDEVRTAEIEVGFPYEGVIDLFTQTKTLSPAFADLVRDLDARQLTDLQERLTEKTAPYTQPDGSFTLPGVALVASAQA